MRPARGGFNPVTRLQREIYCMLVDLYNFRDAPLDIHCECIFVPVTVHFRLYGSRPALAKAVADERIDKCIVDLRRTPIHAGKRPKVIDQNPDRPVAFLDQSSTRGPNAPFSLPQKWRITRWDQCDRTKTQMNPSGLAGTRKALATTSPTPFCWPAPGKIFRCVTRGTIVRITTFQSSFSLKGMMG